MSETKQLEPAPIPSRPVVQPPGWWRKMRGNVLAVSIAIHVLFAFIAGWFVMQHFQVAEKSVPIPRGPDKPLPPSPKSVSVSPPAPVRHIVTTMPSAINLPDIPPLPEERPLPQIAAPANPADGLKIGQTGDLASPGQELKPQLPFGALNVRDGLTGRFYDLKQDRFRKPTGLHMDGYAETVRSFVARGWKDADLARFYRSPSTLGIYQFFIPNTDAEDGPKAFRTDKEVAPTMWLAHYRATVVAPETGRYHFVGAGDDVMLVGFDGRLVLDRCWNLKIKDAAANYNYGYTGIPNGFARGDAIDVVKGRSYPIDVLIGEEPGGKMFAFLFLEKEGATYRHDARGNPILPVFRVKNVPLPAVDAAADLPPYDPAAPAWSVWRVAPPAR